MNGVKTISALPYFARGTVVKGFGRGSKQLGIPTANFPESVVDELPAEIPAGVYYGWSQVDDGPVCEMVMSIGWNPYYNNTKKSMETHLMHKFENDFYGRELGVIIIGYLRPELNFSSLEELIDAIQNDIKQARSKLELPESRTFLNHNFFKSCAISNGHNGTSSNL